MAEFVPSPGCVNCSKCGGWQVLDYTKRDRSMNPIGPLDYRDCDKCEGAGQIRIEPLPVIKTKRGRKPKASVDIDTAIPVPIDDLPPGHYTGKISEVSETGQIKSFTDVKPVANCWHINKETVWGKTTCTDCGKVL